ncbi:hypothetical protein ACH0AB_03930 [Moraxella sp. 179-F 1C4 NHS]
MTTKVVKIDNKVRMITGKLAPHLEIQWEHYTLGELQALLETVVRFEIEHNFRRHKDYKDSKGANIQVFNDANELKVTSLKDELLIIRDSQIDSQ